MGLPGQPLNRLLKNPPFTLRQAQGERREACNRWRFSVRAEPVEARIRLFQQPARDPLCLRRRGRSLYLLNRASRDWHTRIVTLNRVKGLAVRFFAALRMTVLRNSRVKCTNVLNSGLALVGVLVWLGACYPALLPASVQEFADELRAVLLPCST